MGLASYDPGSAHTIFAVYTATSGYVFRHNTDTYVYPAGGASTSVIGSAQSAYDVTETLTGGWKVIAQKYNGTHATHLLRVNGAAATQSTVYFSFDPGDQASATFHIGSPARERNLQPTLRNSSSTTATCLATTRRPSRRT